MDDEQGQREELETPLEQATRAERDRTRASEREADMAVADIDAYVAESDPEALPEAEAALESWQIPTDPLEEGHGAGPDEPLTAVFAAGSEAEAAIVRGLLESQGIPTTLDGLPTRTLGNIFQAGEDRWGDILVPAGLADTARALITSAQSPLETLTDSMERSSMREEEG